MKHLIISCSLNPTSNSRILCKKIASNLKDVEFIDLQDYDLPMCDGDSCYSNPQVQEIRKKIEKAKGVILGIPVYNFNSSASAKNLIELTGKAWQDKIVSFVCAAGGKSSYMSVLPLANSLMLDFRCIILPNYVYASREDFSSDKLSEEIEKRLKILVETLTKFTEVL